MTDYRHSGGWINSPGDPHCDGSSASEGHPAKPGCGPSSSGSPCFNARLELIALHHAGGRDWPAKGDYLYNQGIPIGKIRGLLDQRGKLTSLV
jgi:hypothetical protein